MLLLPNNCRCSEPIVVPKNWKTGGISSLKKDWYIFYRFHDPTYASKYPKGKPCSIKGMNSLKTLEERRSFTQMLLEQITSALKAGYNPISNTTVEKKNKIAPEGVRVITPDTLFVEALEVYQDLKCTKETKQDIAWAVNNVIAAAKKLKIDHLAISEIKKIQLKAIFEKCGYRQDGVFSADKANKTKKNIRIIFNEIVEHEAIDANIVASIKDFPGHVIKIRETLTSEQRNLVNNFLRENHYRFWLFLHIFFYSGARIREIMNIKVKDVDLNNQTVKYVIKKGGQYKEVMRAITNSALNYWQQAIVNGQTDDYVFSKGLIPGPGAINSYQITKRWYRLVKCNPKFNITADFYSLKHSNTTELEELQEGLASLQNAESQEMIDKHYDVGKKARQLEKLKKVNNKFA